ncbi:hypothetical protein [Flexibacterium corallicola]|uniref:hypothetical protein n=1 Tax=Flexibacterium corallicola TaxID=3037259 RepID=UPI00286F93E2|nr:hypothetical protein [Pseudovibrio sp. M1P-2-3]
MIYIVLSVVSVAVAVFVGMEAIGVSGGAQRYGVWLVIPILLAGLVEFYLSRHEALKSLRSFGGLLFLITTFFVAFCLILTVLHFKLELSSMIDLKGFATTFSSNTIGNSGLRMPFFF